MSGTELKQLFIECLELGYLTEDFTINCLNIAKHVLSKHQLPPHAKDEALSEFSLKLLKVWRKIDPEKFTKNYIAAIANSQIWQLKKDFLQYEERKEIISEELSHQFRHKKTSATIIKKFNITPGKFTPEERSKLRRATIRLHKEGFTYTEIEKLLGITDQTAKNWIIIHKGNEMDGFFYKRDRRSKRPQKK